MEKGKNGRSFSSCEHGEKGVPTLFKYLSDPLGPDEAGFEGIYLGPSNEGERARETRARSLPLHPAREVLKRHSVQKSAPTSPLLGEGRDRKISIM
jgi:hypothetical protein